MDRNTRMKLNPDQDFVAALRGKIAANNGYCPCRVEKTDDNKCPCRALRVEHECCCGLYVREASDD